VENRAFNQPDSVDVLQDWFYALPVGYGVRTGLSCPAGGAESACEFAFRVGLQFPEMRLCANALPARG